MLSFPPRPSPCRTRCHPLWRRRVWRLCRRYRRRRCSPSRTFACASCWGAARPTRTSSAGWWSSATHRFVHLSMSRSVENTLLRCHFLQTHPRMFIFIISVDVIPIPACCVLGAKMRFDVSKWSGGSSSSRNSKYHRCVPRSFTYFGGWPPDVKHFQLVETGTKPRLPVRFGRHARHGAVVVLLPARRFC